MLNGEIKIKYAIGLLGAYAGRAYHNWNHIQSMFDAATKLNIGLRTSQCMAILYHDIVYIPGSDHNEQRSARKLVMDCEDMWTRAGMDELMEAYDIIMCTRDHKPTCIHAAVVCDLDLYDLGTDRYRDNARLIREEFKDTRNPDFRDGRLMWLSEMLKRKIYTSAKMPSNLEHNAKCNINEELKQLELGYLEWSVWTGEYKSFLCRPTLATPNEDGVVVPE